MHEALEPDSEATSTTDRRELPVARPNQANLVGQQQHVRMCFTRAVPETTNADGAGGAVEEDRAIDNQRSRGEQNGEGEEKRRRQRSHKHHKQAQALSSETKPGNLVGRQQHVRTCVIANKVPETANAEGIGGAATAIGNPSDQKSRKKKISNIGGQDDREIERR